jgi:hypothetical protein
MLNKITIGTFAIMSILYFVLRYAQADFATTNFIGGIAVGILITIIGTGISKLLKKVSQK